MSLATLRTWTLELIDQVRQVSSPPTIVVPLDNQGEKG